MTDTEFYQELVRRSIKGTINMYGEAVLNNILKRRLISSSIGSVFNFTTIEELRSAIETAEWEPAPIEQAREMCHGSVALVTKSFGGYLGITGTEYLPDDIKIDLKMLMPASKKLNAVIDGKGFKRPYVNTTTLIIEADKSIYGTDLIMSTVCPGFISSKPNEFGIFDAEYTGQRDGLTKEQVLELGYKYVILM